MKKRLRPTCICSYFFVDSITSMTSAQDILITGVGVVSPIGIGRAPFWESMMAGASGVRAIDAFQDTPLQARFGGEILDFEPKKYVKPRKSLKVMCREVQIGFSAATLAVEDANLNTERLDPERLGVVFGSEMLYADIDTVKDVYTACQPEGEFEYDLFGDKSQSKMYPLWMLTFLPNMTACHIGIALDGRGPNNTILNGDASCLMAVSECMSVIQRGLADVMIVGGVGSRLNVTSLAYRAEFGFSHRNDAPQSACRPFDADRDGLVNGEGGAALILETRSHAEARGAKPLAQLTGYGLAFENRQNGRLPSGDGIRYSMQAAMANSQTTPEQIDHVNAHGLSMLEEDRAEAQAIRDVLGAVPVTAPKSFFGHLGAGSGTVELAASVLALHEGRTPHTLNYDSPDPTCPVEVIADEPREVSLDNAMVLSQSFGGQTAAVVISRA